MLISTWNVNSLRNCENSFLQYLETHQPDILTIQELRANPDQLSFFIKYLEGYSSYFNDSGRPGYAGSALFYKKSLDIQSIQKSEEFDILGLEGRLIHFKIDDIHIYSFYAPNGNSSEERFKFKLKYYETISKLAKKLLKLNENVILMGDLNVAHTDLDLFPKKLRMSGCLPVEREWLSKLFKLGFIDTFRMFQKGDGYYSWWNLRDPLRLENRGWRFDYILVSESLKDRVKDAGISREVFGSDHCPVWIELN